MFHVFDLFDLSISECREFARIVVRKRMLILVSLGKGIACNGGHFFDQVADRDGGSFAGGAAGESGTGITILPVPQRLDILPVTEAIFGRPLLSANFSAQLLRTLIKNARSLQSPQLRL